MIVPKITDFSVGEIVPLTLVNNTYADKTPKTSTGLSFHAVVKDPRKPAGTFAFSATGDDVTVDVTDPDTGTDDNFIVEIRIPTTSGFDPDMPYNFEFWIYDPDLSSWYITAKATIILQRSAKNTFTAP